MAFNAKNIAKAIKQNSDDLNAQRISVDEFSLRNRALWEQADQNQPCVIGSACDRRVTAVHVELRALNEKRLEGPIDEKGRDR